MDGPEMAYRLPGVMAYMVVAFFQFVEFFKGLKGYDDFIVLEAEHTFGIMNEYIGVENIRFSAHRCISSRIFSVPLFAAAV